MEKYGFVYIWYDRKHKRYYIGCHWGNEDDGYVCSSAWMMKAFKRRPQDFKRRTIARVYSNRKELHEREFYFLNMIKSHELGKRYYNVRNHHFSHWLVDEKKNKFVREKISSTLKEKYKDPDYYAKYRASVDKRDMSFLTPEFIEKRAAAIKDGWAKSSPIEDRHVRADRGSELDKQRKRDGHRRYLESRTTEQIEDHKKKVAAGKQGKIFETCAGKLWWNNGSINTRSIDPPGPQWARGRISGKQ